MRHPSLQALIAPAFVLAAYLLPGALHAGGEPDPSQKRLDFAKTYLELGASASDGFSGRELSGQSVVAVPHAASWRPHLSIGAYHFWGHAEFFVTIPLGTLVGDEEAPYQYRHSVVTGARYLPWAYAPGKLRPFVGLSWSALEYSPSAASGTDDAPLLSKNFLLVPELGLQIGTNSFAVRGSAQYFHDNDWRYPVSATRFATVSTPPWQFQLSVAYAFEASHSGDAKTDEKWNSYPPLSPVGLETPRFGDFFVGVGPSSSFSLTRSGYSGSHLSYLDDQLSSSLFFEASLGYQFNRQGAVIAAAFRMPHYETRGHRAQQEIQKLSVALEATKFLTDYHGFAPYLGLNAAVDRVYYEEHSPAGHEETESIRVEPGLSAGWDIVPGKTDEALILRTNLRWYPFAEFPVGGRTFHFSQLEYNLIQVILYPGRL